MLQLQTMVSVERTCRILITVQPMCTLARYLLYDSPQSWKCKATSHNAGNHRLQLSASDDPMPATTAGPAHPEVIQAAGHQLAIHQSGRLDTYED